MESGCTSACYRIGTQQKLARVVVDTDTLFWTLGCGREGSEGNRQGGVLEYPSD